MMLFVQPLVHLPLQQHTGPNLGGLGPIPHPNPQKFVYEYMRAHQPFSPLSFVHEMSHWWPTPHPNRLE